MVSIDDATYLNFAAHAAIPRVALNAVQRSVAAKNAAAHRRSRSFFSVPRVFARLGDLDWGDRMKSL